MKGVKQYRSKSTKGNPGLSGVHLFRAIHPAVYLLSAGRRRGGRASISACARWLGSEEVGWICILGAAPFAACGFFKYHGMAAEQLAWAWFKSEFLYPKKLVFQSDSLYYEAMTGRPRRGRKASPASGKSASPSRRLGKDNNLFISPIERTDAYHQNAYQSNEVGEREIHHTKVRTGRHPPSSVSGRMGFFRWGAGSPRPSPLPTSITASPARTIRPPCSSTTRSFFNALDSGATAKITINNRKVNKERNLRNPCCYPCGRTGWTITAESTMKCCSPR